MSTHYEDLFEAARKGTVDDVRFFLENGADVNAKDEDGDTPLHITVQTSFTENINVEVMKYLVSQGADVNAKDGADWTPLHLVCQKNSTEELVKYLISLGVDVHQKNSNLELVKYLQKNSNLELVRYLVSRGSDINAKTEDGDTPLHIATMSNTVTLKTLDVEVLKYLISCGADVNAKNKNGYTPLHIAAMSDSDVEVLKCLISRGADVNAKNNDNSTPLHLAVKGKSDVEGVKYLVLQGAHVNVKDRAGKIPLDYIDGEKDTRDRRETPLYYVKSEKDMLTFVLRGGLRASITSNEESLRHEKNITTSTTPKYWQWSEFLRHFSDIQEFLLIYKDIFVAAGKGTVDAVRFFLEHGEDVNAKDGWGKTPLHNAASSNPNVEVVQYLVSQGADVNAKDEDGDTPLHKAASSNPNVDVLKYLVSLGIDVNATNKEGKTPLDDADFAITHDIHHKYESEKNKKRILRVIEEKKRILREAGGKTGKELQKETERRYEVPRADVNRSQICTRCVGSGRGPYRCWVCQGTGFRLPDRTTPCGDCGTSGLSKCPYCYGSGIKEIIT